MLLPHIVLCQCNILGYSSHLEIALVVSVSGDVKAVDSSWNKLKASYRNIRI